MKKFLTAAAWLVFLGLLVQGVAFGQQTSTGDKQLDSLLGTINEWARADSGGFLKHLSQTFGIPEEEIRQAKEKHGLSDGDTYMATALARKTNRRVGDIAADYKQNQGKGWGVMAMDLGIKPGSPEFKELKANARRSADHMKAVGKSKGQGKDKKKNK